MVSKLLTVTWSIWLQLAPWMLLGAFVAGVMHVVVPAGWIRRQLSGRMGVLKAVVIGVPLPLCSCGVIPVGLGLRKGGAGHGSTIGFLISTPQTGVDSVLVSASFLGWPFAILKVGVAIMTGVVGGMLGNAVSSDSVKSSDPPASTCETPGGVAALFEHALQLIRSIWKWLLVGVAASAVITYFEPAESLQQYSVFKGFSALLITLLFSLPLYVCATASVPLAGALVANGFPPGAALVFLMAGPATNLATLGAVYRTLGARSLGIYLTTIVGGSLAAGMLFNSWIDQSVAQSSIHAHHSSWWSILSGIVLAVLILQFTWQDFRRFVRNRRQGNQPDTVFVELGTSSIRSDETNNAVENTADGQTKDCCCH